MTIEIPDWAIIGKIVKVRDSTGVRTGDINEWCIESLHKLIIVQFIILNLVSME